MVGCKLEQFMNCKAIFCIVVFLILTGCAAQEEPVVTREPTKLITKDDYHDLQETPRKEEPVEADFSKGKTKQSIDIAPKVDPKTAVQEKFLYSATYGSVDELKIRYENGGKINFRDSSGESVLVKVVEGSYDEQTLFKVQYLLSIGAEVNFKGKSAKSERITPLGAAVWKTSAIFKSGGASKKPYFAEQVLKLLIAEGAAVSASNELGRAPLHTAAMSNNIFAARLLLDSGAGVMQRDYDGNTPIDLAKSKEMKKILEEHGAVERKDAMPAASSKRKGSSGQGTKSEDEWEPFREPKPF